MAYAAFTLPGTLTVGDGLGRFLDDALVLARSELFLGIRVHMTR